MMKKKNIPITVPSSKREEPKKGDLVEVITEEEKLEREKNTLKIFDGIELSIVQEMDNESRASSVYTNRFMPG